MGTMMPPRDVKPKGTAAGCDAAARARTSKKTAVGTAAHAVVRIAALCRAPAPRVVMDL
jgi:hypothetical protein